MSQFQRDREKYAVEVSEFNESRERLEVNWAEFKRDREKLRLEIQEAADQHRKSAIKWLHDEEALASRNANEAAATRYRSELKAEILIERRNHEFALAEATQGQTCETNSPITQSGDQDMECTHNVACDECASKAEMVQELRSKSDFLEGICSELRVGLDHVRAHQAERFDQEEQSFQAKMKDESMMMETLLHNHKLFEEERLAEQLQQQASRDLELEQFAAEEHALQAKQVHESSMLKDLFHEHCQLECAFFAETFEHQASMTSAWEAMAEENAFQERAKEGVYCDFVQLSIHHENLQKEMVEERARSKEAAAQELETVRMAESKCLATCTDQIRQLQVSMEKAEAKLATSSRRELRSSKELEELRRSLCSEEECAKQAREEIESCKQRRPTSCEAAKDVLQPNACTPQGWESSDGSVEEYRQLLQAAHVENCGLKEVIQKQEEEIDLLTQKVLSELTGLRSDDHRSPFINRSSSGVSYSSAVRCQGSKSRPPSGTSNTSSSPGRPGDIRRCALPSSKSKMAVL